MPALVSFLDCCKLLSTQGGQALPLSWHFFARVTVSLPH